MENFKKYKRTQIAELREVTYSDISFYREYGFIMCGDMGRISISLMDKENGSPKIGDMIARNPEDDHDQWLVDEDYFKKNFEKIEE